MLTRPMKTTELLRAAVILGIIPSYEGQQFWKIEAILRERLAAGKIVKEKRGPSRSSPASYRAVLPDSGGYRQRPLRIIIESPERAPHHRQTFTSRPPCDGPRNDAGARLTKQRANMHSYRQDGDGWTVSFFNADGSSVPIKEFPNESAAASYTSYLNGGVLTYRRPFEPTVVRNVPVENN